MTTPDLVLAIITTTLGLVFGVVVSYYFFRRGPVRPRLIVGMESLAHIDPSTVGVQVEMKVGSREVTNLLLLEVMVTNRGPTDLIVDDALDATKHPLRPRIELPADLRILADPWNPTGSTPGSDVRLARQLRDDHQVIFIHIHRLAKGASVRSRILCTRTGQQNSPALTPDGLGLFPGFLPGVDVVPAGLLKAPAVLLDK